MADNARNAFAPELALPGGGTMSFANAGNIVGDSVNSIRKMDAGTPGADVFEKLKKAASEELDFSTKPDSAVFWSDKNMRIAQKWAADNNKTTLEQTLGGKYLDDLDLFGKGSPLNPKQAAEIWDIASKRFAQGASGNVYVFSTGAKKISQYGHLRTWWRIERPTLMENKKNKIVNEIIRMKKDGTLCK